MSTVNLVKFYFYKNNVPGNMDRVHKLIALAYQTARDRQIYPKAVLIRSDVHGTTTLNGVRQQDPLGIHVTFCYKDQTQLNTDTHVAAHGYVTDKESLTFVKATHADEKPDGTRKKKGIAWPDEDKLWEAPEIGYGHLGEDGNA